MIGKVLRVEKREVVSDVSQVRDVSLWISFNLVKGLRNR